MAGVQQNNRLANASRPDPSPMPGGPISVSYGYDSVGNCVSEGSERKYEWDHAGRLRSFRNQAADTSEPTQYVQFLYDAAGQRVKKLNRKRTGANWDAISKQQSGISSQRRRFHVVQENRLSFPVLFDSVQCSLRWSYDSDGQRHDHGRWRNGDECQRWECRCLSVLCTDIQFAVLCCSFDPPGPGSGVSVNAKCEWVQRGSVL